MRTLVVQAWAGEAPDFIGSCLDTVRDWAALRGFEYRFETDALFADVPDWYRERVSGLVVPMSNYGRLHLLRRALTSGYDRAVWCDADVVIFDAVSMNLRGMREYSLSREVWTELDAEGGVRHDVRINGCFMMFERANPFLDFALHALAQRAEREPITEPRGTFTRLLTELGQIVPLRTVAHIGMMSPLLMDEIARDDPQHVRSHMEKIGVPLCGVNVSAAFRDLVHKGVHMTDAVYERVIERCLATGGELFNRYLPTTRALERP